MKAGIIIDHQSPKVKFTLDWKNSERGQRLTTDEPENVTKLIEQAAQQASQETFKQC